ncbi:BexC/CtrB/KpsE family polysaccharide export inner-membrane protein [Pacificibacter maritimus]|uniref:BexC/CtrB/KpsE family polysaccharide export inner-membrane protein n=1 Tax=Pacificibacter maritimus TaxID=762213 RepID=A0A3N4U7A8_9RHOB|nr:sugar transporter [Pacificibacter maritimus]RPE62829.1 BexC/CtrB/KpsE family polysaccharide export inner-membrane protein [Pacificibacter maritimus]
MQENLGIAGPAQMEKRHYGILYSFGLAVLLPLVLSAVYLWGFARDQYISSMSFSVRTESLQSATDLLGGLSSITGSSSSDVDILTQFIASSDLIEIINKEIDLRDAFSQAWPRDFIYAFNPSGQREDLNDYWNNIVTTQSENGILTLSVRSYDPKITHDITLAIYEASRDLINRLSDEAHSDATRFSRDELQSGELRLSAAREAMTNFRLEAKIVDPNVTLQAQMGILTQLQAQLAETLVQRNLLSRSARETDPRLNEANRKISALQAQIEVEQQKFSRGGQGPGEDDYATLFADFERLTSDLLFAEEAYRSAQLTYTAALAEAKRTARYLVAHVQPTLAEKSRYPNRFTKLIVVGLFVSLMWSVGLLIFYSIRDRR